MCVRGAQVGQVGGRLSIGRVGYSPGAKLHKAVSQEFWAPHFVFSLQEKAGFREN